MRPAEYAEPSQRPASSIEVAEAFKELVQATLLVSTENPGLFVGPKNLCNRCGGGTWKDTWR